MRYKLNVRADYGKVYASDFRAFKGEYAFAAKNMTAAKEVAEDLLPAMIVSGYLNSTNPYIDFPWEWLDGMENIWVEASKEGEGWRWQVKLEVEGVTPLMVNQIAGYAEGSSFGLDFIREFVALRTEDGVPTIGEITPYAVIGDQVRNTVAPTYVQFQNWARKTRTTCGLNERVFTLLIKEVF